MHNYRILPALLFLLFSGRVSAQLNSRLLSQVDYEAEVNDIWGWVAPDGTEYALVGTTDGVSIVSLADPADAREVAFVPGQFSVWRDLKTFGNFAYVTADQPNSTEGLLVIDLSNLPDGVTASRWQPAPDRVDTLERCHNLYIDESGTAYLSGCDLNNGGIIFVDVASSPGQPEFIGFGPAIYSHDVYVQDNRMFTSEIYAGQLGIYDVSDKNAVRPLAAQATPFRFTHNAWASPDGRYVFTTDERANAPTAAFDVSDPGNILPLDEYRPPGSLGQGVIPHNVHVRDNWLVISHYTDGLRVVDATRPENLVEVANYDTYPAAGTGFNGAWGAYPFLPSGLALVSDIQSGLFVVEVDYVRAAYLEGRVTAAAGGAPIRDAEIRIEGPQNGSGQPNLGITDSRGDYRSGLAGSGSYEVVVRHPEYREQRIPVTLTAGEVTRLDVQLVSKLQYSIGGITVEKTGSAPIAGTKIVLRNDLFTYNATAGDNGRFQLAGVFEGTYDLFAGAWGYRHRKLGSVEIDQNASLTVTLEPGYQDDFLFDLGWTTESDALTGHWVRGNPDGVRSGSVFVSPPADIATDYGEQAYLTGNAGGSPRTDDVDDGTVTLISPPFDLTDYHEPVLSYYLWFFDDFGNSEPDDALQVWIHNGVDSVLLEEITESAGAWRPQSAFRLAGLIGLSADMRLVLRVSDLPGNGHVVEAAIDAFLVQEENTTGRNDPPLTEAHLQAFPNPFAGPLTVGYRIDLPTVGRAELRLFDSLGRELARRPLDTPQGQVSLDISAAPGVYYLFLEVDGKRGPAIRVVKAGQGF